MMIPMYAITLLIWTSLSDVPRKAVKFNHSLTHLVGVLSIGNIKRSPPHRRQNIFILHDQAHGWCWNEIQWNIQMVALYMYIIMFAMYKMLGNKIYVYIFQGNCADTMVDDALAPWVDRTSAIMLLNVTNALFFYGEWFLLPMASHYWKNIENASILLCSLK